MSTYQSNYTIAFHDLTCVFIAFFFAVIKEESIDSRAEVKSFDHNKLKHVETQEKNQLPSAGGTVNHCSMNSV